MVEIILQLVKSFFFPVAVILSSLSLAISGLSIGIWLPEKVNALPEAPGIVEHFKIVLNHSTDFTSPSPYFVFSLVLMLAGSLEVFTNRYWYGEYGSLQKRLRDETQNHGESQKNYFDSLGEALRYMLAGDSVGFDKSCRVTIYRLQKNSTGFLKRIFRYSEHRAYMDNGRFSIPASEGLVGLAWNNHGKVTFEYTKFGKAADQELQSFLKANGGTAPTCSLSMPSSSFVIRAVEDLDSRQRIAIVVFESVKKDVLREGAIDALLDREGKALSRLIKHLGALDGKFNPDKGGIVS